MSHFYTEDDKLLLFWFGKKAIMRENKVMEPMFLLEITISHQF